MTPETTTGRRYTAEYLTKASSAVYLACEESVANDLSAMLQQAAQMARVVERLTVFYGDPMLADRRCFYGTVADTLRRILQEEGL